MKKNSNVTTAEYRKIEQMVKRCMRLLRKKEYELELPTNCPDIAAKVLEVRKTMGYRSRAGAHVIKINIAYPYLTFHEYKAFKDHPTIGSIQCNDWEDVMQVLVAHEVSHHVQYRYCWRVKRFRQNYVKPHGECFKQIYSYLRRDLVNPMIKEKAAAKVAA